MTRRASAIVVTPADLRRTCSHAGAAADPEPGDFPPGIRALVIDTMDRDIASLRHLTNVPPSPRAMRDIAAMLHRLQGAAAVMRWPSLAALVERARKQTTTGGGDDAIAPLIAFWKRARRAWLRGVARLSPGVDGERDPSCRATPDS